MRKIENILSYISAGLLLWFVVSFIDVVTHNMVATYSYPAWNLFNIFVKFF